MLIGLRNATAGKRLPYDAEVEWLESTGTQWIDTGVKHNEPHTFNLQANCVPYQATRPSERDFFGAHSGVVESGNMVCGMIAPGVVFLFNRPNTRIDSNSLGTSKLDVNIECVFTSDSRTLVVNGTSYYQSGASYYDCPITLFKGNPGTTSGSFNGKFKCFGFQIYNANGVLVRDFQPVRFTNELGQTEGAMFDRANPTVGMNPDGSARDDGLYLNRGTGAFIYGSDKARGASAANGGGGVSANA